MAAFHLFQRVRLARPVHMEFLGDEGVITELGEFGPGTETSDGTLGEWADCVVLWDDGEESYQCTDQLEPLRYLPSPEDFASIEGDLPRGPVRDPSQVPGPVSA